MDAESLFRHYAEYVARFLARLGVPPTDIDDVLQEVFLVAHARGGYVPGPAKPTSYLGAIATRAALGHKRKLRNQARRSSAAEPEQIASQHLDPVQVLQVSQAEQRLNEAIATLDPVLAATLLLVEYEGESCASVAAAMGTALGTIHWRLHKARKLLRKILERDETPKAHVGRVRSGREIHDHP